VSDYFLCDDNHQADNEGRRDWAFGIVEFKFEPPAERYFASLDDHGGRDRSGTITAADSDQKNDQETITAAAGVATSKPRL
jgi:hypothetical protein